MTGWCTDWVAFLVRWVTELRSTRLHRPWGREATGKEREDLEIRDYGGQGTTVGDYGGLVKTPSIRDYGGLVKTPRT